MGLTAYEYTCTHGVNIGEATARAIGQEARKWDIALSIHAPYYINLVSKDEDKRAKTKWHIMDSLGWRIGWEQNGWFSIRVHAPGWTEGRPLK